MAPFSQMKFSTKIVALQHREWAEYYLNYNDLKRILAEVEPTPSIGGGVDDMDESSLNDGVGGIRTSIDSRESVSLLAKTHFRDEVVTSAKFLAALYKETQKICLFALKEQGQIAEGLDACDKKQDELATIYHALEDADETSSPEFAQLPRRFRELRDTYNRVGANLLHLIQYVDLNNQGILRLLKKHDKRVRDRHNRAYELFLTGRSRTGRRSNNNSAALMGSLQHYESLDALCVTLQTGYTHLRLVQDSLFEGGSDTITDGSSSQGSVSTPYHAAMTQTDLERGRALMRSSIKSKPKPRNRSPKGLGRRFKSNQGLAEMSQFLAADAEEYLENERSVHKAANFALLTERRLSTAVTKQEHDDEEEFVEEEAERVTGTSFVLDPQDILMAEIYAARREMQHQSHDVVNMLATTALGFVPEPAGIHLPGHEGWHKAEYEQAAALADYKKKSAISGVLNLVSSFIYMANYLIVVPTVVTYSNKLGADPALSSFIVGMTPFATIFSTVLYSWWTSYSYRVPLMFAACLNIAGNIVYAMGYPCNSMVFVLIGRLMQGLGSCRPINRRYIADAYSTAERTAASAIFVAVGSFGMALGPFLGSLLHRFAEHSSSPYWQVENAPGFFMAAVWSVYVICHMLFFVDPPKQEDDDAKPTTNGASRAGGAGEGKPLLGDKVPTTSDREVRRVPIWKNSAVMVNFFIYFIMKLLMECVSSSTSILTYYYFGWPGSWAGYWLAFLCFLVLPVNLVVAHLSKTYEDREMMMVMQAVTITGCIIIMRYGQEYYYEQYLCGTLIIVVFSNMVEGPNMSLLSKTIPKAWRKGFLNVGLLATEAATLGRTVGDIWLALCGLPGLEHQLNLTFGSMIIATTFTLWISYRYYDSLVATEDKTL